MIIDPISGWTPSRKVIDVVLGLDSLFTDLIDFDDPLNMEAAEMHLKSKVSLL